MCRKGYMGGRVVGVDCDTPLDNLTRKDVVLNLSSHQEPCFTIVDREAEGLTRNIKEAMYIKVNDPSLNRNLGKFQIP